MCTCIYNSYNLPEGLFGFLGVRLGTKFKLISAWFGRYDYFLCKREHSLRFRYTDYNSLCKLFVVDFPLKSCIDIR